MIGALKVWTPLFDGSGNKEVLHCRNGLFCDLMQLLPALIPAIAAGIGPYALGVCRTCKASRRFLMIFLTEGIKCALMVNTRNYLAYSAVFWSNYEHRKLNAS